MLGELAMSYQSGDEFLQNLPLILAGPILQRIEPESVTVWVALKQANQVELKVYDTTNNGTLLENCLFVGKRFTVALGKSLHIVAVTARSTGTQQLSSDRIYAYDLKFTNQIFQTQQSLQQALCSNRFPIVNISYFEHQKPTFVLPPSHLQDLRIVHGSCRKPHGNGFDALPILDCLIEKTASQPCQRPHQLFLTGDQIYGDDVADPLLWASSRLGDALLGWEEQLPVTQKQPTDPSYYTPKQLPPGHRVEIATYQAGFTAGLHNKSAKVASHLLSLGEYYASYLLVWSQVCWPATFSMGRGMMDTRKARHQWDLEVRDMREFIHTLWKVRRALANIPMYSIFDDHDVSDDWNLNQAWCLRVLGKPLGQRTVQNALLAYAVFQGWGNTPEQFQIGESGGKLLSAAQKWSASQGTDTAAYNAIARYLGMPPTNPHTGLPEFVKNGSVLLLNRHPDAVTWHYTIRSSCHEVIVLDTRTWRGYPADQKPTAPPMLLCREAFERQLSQPLQQTPQIPATFVIAPTNLFGLQVIDWIHHLQLRRDKVFSTDVGDSWNIHTEALARFLSILFEQRQQVIVLSGDIHYSSVVRMSYANSQAKSVLVQLTASALKNEETITRLIHTRLKDWFFREKVRRWVGWFNPPDMVEITARQTHSARTHLLQMKPEWNCLLEWIPRQKNQTADFERNLSWLMTTKNFQWKWLERLMFWKSSWFQDGREVVGLNNLALVHLELADIDSAYKVIQDLYWFSSWYPTQIVYSRFETELAPNPFLDFR